MDTQATLYQGYSLCTEDCEHGNHVGGWIKCDRCRSSIHVKVFEVYHPPYGDMRIGSECFKDVMGFNFGKTHEKALETRDILLRLAEKVCLILPSQTFIPKGEFTALGLPRDGTGVNDYYDTCIVVVLKM